VSRAEARRAGVPVEIRRFTPNESCHVVTIARVAENWCENERPDGKICSEGGRYENKSFNYIYSKIASLDAASKQCVADFFVAAEKCPVLVGNVGVTMEIYLST